MPHTDMNRLNGQSRGVGRTVHGVGIKSKDITSLYTDTLRCVQNTAHRAPHCKSEFLAHMNESLNEPSVGLGFSAGTYGFTACGGNAVREVEV